MKITAITKENIEGFRYLMLPEVAAAIRKGEDVGALGLYEEGESVPAAVGAITGLASRDLFRILSIYVEKKYRGQGLGKQLLDAFCSEAERYELPLCVDYLSTTPEHAELEGFLTHLGFQKIEPVCPVVRFCLDDLDETEISQEEEMPISEGIVEEVSEKVLILPVTEVHVPIDRMADILAAALQNAKKRYPGDTQVYMYVANDLIGDFIGQRCKTPEIVSQRYMR